MMNAECGMMNVKRLELFNSSFRIPHSSFLSNWSRAETRQSNFQTVSLMTSTNPHGIRK